MFSSRKQVVPDRGGAGLLTPARYQCAMHVMVLQNAGPITFSLNPRTSIPSAARYGGKTSAPRLPVSFRPSGRQKVIQDLGMDGSLLGFP